MKKVFLAIIFFIIFICRPALAQAATYYVATNGNDSNAGSQSAPWRTIQKAANTLVAGDTVLVGSGVYYENIKPKNAGTANNYIVYKNAPGAKPVIDGSTLTGDLFENSWGQGKSYIEINGFELRNSPASGITVAGGTKYMRILNCDIHDNQASGIQVQGNSQGTSHLYVQYVKSYNNGNQESGGHGIIFYNGGDYSEIYDSQFYNNGRERGGDVWASGIEINRANYIVAKRNTVYGNIQHGVDVCQAAHDNLIADNIAYTNDRAALAVDMDAYNNTLDHNVVYDVPSITWGGGIVFLMNAHDNILTNNTVYGTKNAEGILFLDTSSINNIVKNNITYGNEGGSMYIRTANNLKESDYNDFSENRFYYNGKSTDLNGYRSATGKNTHSISVDPQFNSVANRDFHLKPGSPVIDAGVDIGLPYSGNAPDMGAFEYGSGGSNPTATPGGSCALKTSGDLNCDGHINESDLNLLLNRWSTTTVVPTQYQYIDLTGDGIVNESDLNKLLGNWKTN